MTPRRAALGLALSLELWPCLALANPGPNLEASNAYLAVALVQFVAALAIMVIGRGGPRRTFALSLLALVLSFLGVGAAAVGGLWALLFFVPGAALTLWAGLRSRHQVLGSIGVAAALFTLVALPYGLVKESEGNLRLFRTENSLAGEDGADTGAPSPRRDASAP